MKIETLPIGSIYPYPNNPRVITDRAIAAVAASIEKFGWQQPIVVDKNNVIVVGHTRRQAALHLGITEVPVHVADYLSEEQINAYRLMDNKAGEFSQWDDDALQAEMMQLDMGELSEFFLDGLDKYDFDVEDDEDADDEDADDEPYNMGNPIIQYNIVFDDEDQQVKWHAFVRTLKTMYDDEPSIAARLMRFIEENV